VYAVIKEGGWLSKEEAYGMDAVDATITDVVGTFALT